MASRKLILTVVAHQPYIRHFSDSEKYETENEILFKAISKTYIPLLNMFERLEKDGIDFKIALVLSPVLCSLLSDSLIKEQYLSWLDKRIVLGEKELVRCKKDAELLKRAEKCLEEARQEKTDFTEKYNSDLIAQFRSYSDKGYVELLATCGTSCYVPHYSDMTEILNAQVETGIYSHKQFFGSAPDGFYIPYHAYSKGFDRIVRSYGVNYTIVSPATLLFARDIPPEGVFAPVRTHYSLVLFARDNEYPCMLYDEKGAKSNPVYKNLNRDIGFELAPEDLGEFYHADRPRVSTLYRYWANDGKTLYDEEKARAQAHEDAMRFIECKTAKLEKAAGIIKDRDVCSIFEIDAKLLGQTWEEGVFWLEEVIRNVKGIKLSVCGTMLKNQFTLPRVEPYPCSDNGSGYGEDLLDNSNNYMIRYIRKMCERIVDLAGRFVGETGLKERLLNLASRELLIAQDASWAQMIHDGENVEYAQNVFRECVLNFTAVFDSLGTNTVSTEWLTRVEKEHPLFPWMNYIIFKPKV